MKKGQVTIFIVLSVLIIAGIIAYFGLRAGFLGDGVSEELQPAYDYYISCLEDATIEGIQLMSSQGGRIDEGEFFPGSAYMPFSSHLDFMGQGVAYWMYVSGNNLLKENVPTKASMERELASYVEDRISSCDFSELEAQGYDIFVDEGSVEVDINDLKVGVSVRNNINIYKGDASARVSSHKFEVSSKLGKFFGMAKKVYDYERESAFLENYALDVLRLYAPVDGVEEGCTPKVFIQEDIAEELKNGLAANIATIKLDGGYYGLIDDEREYFVEESGIEVDENVNFMYMKDWPTRVEIYGDLVAKPVGLQEGLGILGFCYVPYHLIYDIDFPVMIQFYDDEEFFQFPIGIVISKNQAREALPTDSGVSIEDRVCEVQDQEVTVYTFDEDLEPVEAMVAFKCLDSVCNIGETSLVNGEAVLEGDFPSCVNGFIEASSEGYATSKFQISTNSERVANVLMKKKYELGLDLGSGVSGAVVSFTGEDFSETVLYPEMKSVELVEGFYNVSVYVYSDSGLVIPASSRRECVDVPEEGLAGLFGAETEKCYDIDLPKIDVDYAIVGGGKTSEYVTVEDLRNSREINLNIPLFGVPGSIEELAENAELAESEVVYVSFE